MPSALLDTCCTWKCLFQPKSWHFMKCSQWGQQITHWEKGASCCWCFIDFVSIDTWGASCVFRAPLLDVFNSHNFRGLAATVSTSVANQNHGPVVPITVTIFVFKHFKLFLDIVCLQLWSQFETGTDRFRCFEGPTSVPEGHRSARIHPNPLQPLFSGGAESNSTGNWRCERLPAVSNSESADERADMGEFALLPFALRSSEGKSAGYLRICRICQRVLQPLGISLETMYIWYKPFQIKGLTRHIQKFLQKRNIWIWCKNVQMSKRVQLLRSWCLGRMQFLWGLVVARWTTLSASENATRQWQNTWRRTTTFDSVANWMHCDLEAAPDSASFWCSRSSQPLDRWGLQRDVWFRCTN